MVIVDVFIARSRTAAHSIEALRARMDRGAPGCCLVHLPDGEPAFIFAVDFHRRPAGVCARMGFEYAHVGFAEVSARDYAPENMLKFDSFRWLRLMLMHWSHNLLQNPPP
jgi:hypothetical protein